MTCAPVPTRFSLVNTKCRVSEAGVTPQTRELWDGVTLAVIAITSALLTATLVIGLGEAILRSRSEPPQAQKPSMYMTIETVAP